jgi:hypothetical protein
LHLLLQDLTTRALAGESDRSLKFGKSAGMWLFNDRGWDHEDNLGASCRHCTPCRPAAITELWACWLTRFLQCASWWHCQALLTRHRSSTQQRLHHQLRPAAGKGKHIEFNNVGQNTVELWTLESGGGWIHPVHIHLVVRIFGHPAVSLVLASCLAAHLPVENSQLKLL